MASARNNRKHPSRTPPHRTTSTAVAFSILAREIKYALDAIHVRYRLHTTISSLALCFCRHSMPPPTSSYPPLRNLLNEQTECYLHLSLMPNSGQLSCQSTAYHLPKQPRYHQQPIAASHRHVSSVASAKSNAAARNRLARIAAT